MTDFGKLLSYQADAIVERWVEAVRQDEQIEITQELTHKALRDSLPKVLEAMATILSQSEVNDTETLVEASLEHGVVRSQQGFEPSEIAREYRLLRSVIFSSLEAELMQGSPKEILRAVRLIDTVIDEAIARCFNSYTEGRLQELKQLQTQLQLTNQELTRLVLVSKSNLSHLAHELKTPLTSIIGYSDLFLRQQRLTTTKDSLPNLESIERVLRGGRQLLRLINDALEISRYEAGATQPQLTRLNVKELIDAVVEIAEPLLHQKDLQLQVSYDRAPAEIMCDELRLQQILTNLLSNAIRYTEQGKIQLICEQISNQKWTIAVTDSGIGIPVEDQKRVFEPYFRSQSDLSSTTDGTGLGLAIVARLVTVLQGEIQLQSQPGAGSTFLLTLPIDGMPDDLES